MSALAAPPPPLLNGTPLGHDSGWRPSQHAPRARRRLMVALVAGAHLLAAWALFHTSSVHRVLPQAVPLFVALLAADKPPLQPPAQAPWPLPRVRQTALVPALQPLAAPAVVLALPAPRVAEPADPLATPAPAVAATTKPTAPPHATPPGSEGGAAAAAAAPSPSPPPPAPRQVLAATAVRYLQEPPVEVPRAARRAGEHGVVTLRVVVSTLGVPVQVTVLRSSGYSRLDEQALWAMRQARFQPHTENGRAVEVEVIAPIEYPLA